MIVVVNRTNKGFILLNEETMTKQSLSVKTTEDLIKRGLANITGVRLAPELNPMWRIGGMDVQIYRPFNVICGRFNICFCRRGIAYGRTLKSKYEVDTIEVYDLTNQGKDNINGLYIASYAYKTFASHRGRLYLYSDVPAWVIVPEELNAIRKKLELVKKVCKDGALFHTEILDHKCFEY